MYTLRDYQQQAVDNTLSHFRRSQRSAVIVLPTGAGKSLVIAELARLARHPILVLTHVKELVEQNADKFKKMGLKPGIYSAGLNEKNLCEQVTFASIQSLARSIDKLQRIYSLVIIDECHRVSNDSDSQYAKVIAALKKHNPSLKVLGLTATPYRLETGWVYHRHYHGFVKGKEDAPFSECIYELPLRYLINKGYLTKPRVIDAAVTHYDFSSLLFGGRPSEGDVNTLLANSTRATKAIMADVIAQAQTRQGVMIFAATVAHAKEILSYLPSDDARIIVADTAGSDRDTIINDFKQRSFKYLVNVSVLTTGFDAPHVDFIAILRPTESVSLYQQIVGRGLRLCDGKSECLVIDYAGNGFDLHYPEVGVKRPDPNSEPVQVMCPGCGFANLFWGKKDAQGNVIEHYGRRCKGLLKDDEQSQQCDFRFKFKECPGCFEQNDIAARQCHSCALQLVDPDDKLRKALNLTEALVIRCSGLSCELTATKKLKITYYDEDGASVDELYDLSNAKVKALFNRQYGSRHHVKGLTQWQNAQQVIESQHLLVWPDFVIAKKSKKYGWQISDKLFDYQGSFRKANQMH
ncbi:DEAD/DEAH box helicase [Pseudoalteromonas sp. SSDWG2]|uniref:DEAD/DEAH box helicase n=1 Tax=Pseudoalteromonas sp. SSDWG2 TaxID=3139391 RepID=UPI003BA9C9DF